MIYMLRNDDTRKWYRRAQGIQGNWVGQDKASSWPTLAGPASAKGRIKVYNTQRRRDVPSMTIIEFELVATGVEK
jgi:hypothetical protein